MKAANPKSIRVVFDTDWNEDDMRILSFDFNMRLQSRGTDFRVFTNTGYRKSSKDSQLLVKIMERLVGNHPIKMISVTPYELHIQINRATEPQDIVGDVIAAARCLGFAVDSRNASY